MANIPYGPDSITPRWLTSALRSDGAIRKTAVCSITKKRIGEDESFSGGALLRLEIEYDPVEQGAPKSLIAKLSPIDPNMRMLLKASNGREALFYTKLAAQSNLPIPRGYYGDFNTQTGACILLLEDLSHYRSVEYVAGCKPDDVEHVVQALAKIHTYWWDSPQLKEIGGVSILDEFPFSELWSQYPPKVAELLPDMLIPDVFLLLANILQQMSSHFLIDCWKQIRSPAFIEISMSIISSLAGR